MTVDVFFIFLENDTYRLIYIFRNVIATTLHSNDILASHKTDADESGDQIPYYFARLSVRSDNMSLKNNNPFY